MAAEKTLWLGNSEIRLIKDKVDEIVIRDKEGKCLFHLERHDSTCFHLQVAGGGKAVHVDLFTHSESIGVRHREERQDAPKGT